MGLSMCRALVIAIVVILALASPSYAPYFRDPSAADDDASSLVRNFDLYRYSLEHSAYADATLPLTEADRVSSDNGGGF